MKSRAGAAAIAAFAAAAVLTACQFPQNPVRAGGDTGAAAALDHNVVLLSVKHAEGYCRPAEYCAVCHGANLQGGEKSQPSCTGCHGALWTRTGCGRNGHVVDLGGHLHEPGYCLPYQSCGACHGAGLGGGPAGEPSCLSCHDRTRWKNCGTVQHTVNRGGSLHAPGSGAPESACAPCHGAGLRGGPNGEPSCYACHGEVWKGGASGHTSLLGGVGHKPEYCRPYQNCVSCHGSSLRGGIGGEPSCLNCHTQTEWKNCGATQHNKREGGVTHAEDMERPDRDCAPCHGADLRGGPNGEKSCTACHGKKW